MNRALLWLDTFIPLRDRLDAEKLRKGRILTRLYGLGVVLCFVLSLAELAAGRIQMMIPGTIFIGLFMGMIVLFSKGVSSIALNNVLMVFIYLAFGVGLNELGGLHASNLPFILLFPLVAMFTSGLKSSVFWLIVSILIIVCVTYLESHVVDELMFISEQNPPILRAGYMLGALIITFALVTATEQSRIENQNLLKLERTRSEELLLNILPQAVAEELKTKGEADARLIDNATVLFTDFKGFTALSEKISPEKLVQTLHECFSAFDNICEKYGIEKIKTIGDAYMAAGGLPISNTTHANDTVKAALEMAAFVAETKARKEAARLPFFEVRIGIHSGPVVAGIVGIKKFQYDIWGDTVNTASRMESSGEVGRLNISETTYQLVKDDFECTFRGEIEAKGKGKMGMWFVEKKSDRTNPIASS